jgi:HD-GYP domain-containing protein (c-di-GMP phosphodiesterase class II)
MIEVVIHHHEHLDGTGYPHGLKSNEISDLVRMVTIADVFAAMIEWRSYRTPMSCRAAYNILVDMGPKLDQQLVREFQAVARNG